jgi:hypothetical protein
MATVTVSPGALITLDPSDKKIIIFDFDALNLAASVELTNSASTYGITITPLKYTTAGQYLTFDNAGLVTGNRKVKARFLATTANRGDRYRVSCKGTTNESPVQENEYSIFVQIEDR